MNYSIIDTGMSRSFERPHPFFEKASPQGDVVVVLGSDVGKIFASSADLSGKTAVLLELGTECLGVHTGESRGEEGSNVLGFARFRLGNAAASNLVELVRQPCTPAAVIAAARQVFEAAGLKVAVCGDFPGRIIDRLVRPYYNAALKRLDEGLATAADMDLTLRLGLGYPQGPISLLEQSGLEHHFCVTQALYEATAEQAYAPARRAHVARQRHLAE